MHIRAIETEWNNTLFRSRTEAKWAHFFDALSIAYEYEPEGFEMEGIKYLPDFWMPSLNAYIEIKGVQPNEEECEKARRLNLGSGFPVYIFFGNPKVPTLPHCDSAWKYTDGRLNTAYWWTECLICRCVGPASEGCVLHLPCAGCGSEIEDWKLVHGHNTPRLKRAYREAASTRYERLPKNLRNALCV